jgi:ribonuclease HI
VYCYGTRQKLSFSTGQYTTVFQAEVYAIKACTVENLDRNYKNRNTHILSDSQAAIKALGKHQTTSKLDWDCHQSLIQLAKHNRLQLIQLPSHEGTAGNETADQLARTGSENPLTGLEPACGISTGVAKKVVRDWMNRYRKNIGNPQLDSGKGTYTRTLCQKNEGSVEVKQRPIKMGGRTIYRTLSPKRTPFQTGIDR